MRWFRLAFVLAARSVIHPRDGVALVRLSWRFRRRRWFVRFPFLPLPPADYLAFRMYTAYGDPDRVPPVTDVVHFARWATRDE
jgi:hypothetical protein